MSSLEQEQQSIIAELRRENEALKRQLEDFKRLIFGKKNERFVALNDGQTALFDTSETGSQVEGSGSAPKEITYQRNPTPKDKQKPVRTELPAHLPREEEVIEPEDLPEDVVKIGEAITETLEYKPAVMYVRKIVRPKYKLVDSASKAHSLTTEILVAPLPSQPIPSGNAGPSLLAYLFISKYIDHLPYYRQVQMFKRDGIKLSESTISGWFKAVCKLLEPLYEELKSQVLASEYLMGDETTIPVQSSNKPGATHTGYMWVYRSPVRNLVMFDYQKSRSGHAPAELLKEYRGTLQTDGYVGYEQFDNNPNITLIGCMAHARRHFEKALDNDRARAQHALTLIQKLYAIERQAQNDQLAIKEITTLRQQQAIPILNNFHSWMKDQYTQVAPKSSIGKALSYSLKLWSRLTRYTENGLWRIDNNLVENSIRPVALGRKNYLFAGNHQAAQHAAMMYTFFGSCKLHEIEPRAWLTDVLSKIPNTKLSQLASLLPNDKQISKQ